MLSQQQGGATLGPRPNGESEAGRSEPGSPFTEPSSLMVIDADQTSEKQLDGQRAGEGPGAAKEPISKALFLVFLGRRPRPRGSVSRLLPIC